MDLFRTPGTAAPAATFGHAVPCRHACPRAANGGDARVVPGRDMRDDPATDAIGVDQEFEEYFFE